MANTKYQVYVKPESLDTSIWYPFTINPDDSFQNWNHGSQRIRRFIDSFIKLILYKVDYCHLKLHLEVSPLGRLHFHGRIKVIDILQFFLQDVKVFIATSCFKIGEDMKYDEDDDKKEYKTWDEYCKKQEHIFPKGVVKYIAYLPDGQLIKANQIKYNAGSILKEEDLHSDSSDSTDK